ncbi:MAG: hypothetical protein NT070_06680 [Cyanobacteria bacterium]|nr:hypothetical protein [Cyanobacteriota bacterium]
MNLILQIIYRFGILVPLGFCASQVVGAVVLGPVAVPVTQGTTAFGSSKDIFVPQPNHPPLFTQGSGTR